jgi:porin
MIAEEISSCFIKYFFERCPEEDFGMKEPFVSGPNGRKARRHRAGVAAIWLTLLGPLASTAPAAHASEQDGTRQEVSAVQQSGLRGFADTIGSALRKGHRRLEQAGLTIDASVELEGFSNFRGGIKTGQAAASTVDLGLTADTEKLLHWPGGTFHVDLQDHAGENPTTELVGDLQIFDKLNSAPYLQVFELWYQQKLFADRLRLKIGKVDANSEFSVIDNGLDFENSSAQVSPTVFLLPTTPAPMPSTNLFFSPRETGYGSFGIYYSNRSVSFGNFLGSPEDVQPSDNGMFVIGETGLRWRQDSVFGHDGNLKLGAWDHTGTFTRFDGGRQEGTYGWYAIYDQTIRQPAGASESSRGLRCFLEYGRTQQTINTIDWHTGGGLAWTGMFAVRPNDVAGFTSQYAHISKQAGLPHAYELALELFYKVQVRSWAELQPDLQCILHPGGQYPTALVGTLRMKAVF